MKLLISSWFHTYWHDLLTTIVAILLVFVVRHYVSSADDQFWSQVIILSAGFFAILIFRSRDRDLVVSRLQSKTDEDQWLGYGSFKYLRSEDAFEITNADPGYLHAKCLTWSDYRLEFDFKIANKGLGIVVRAIDLSKYIMLQINPNSIIPHVRMSGAWLLDKGADLSFSESLSKDNWYHAQMKCDKNKIWICVYLGKEQLLDRTWEMPQGSAIFVFYIEGKETKVALPVNFEFGSVGFRNCGDERAFVKNVLVRKI
jgi:hypothetical protein